MKDLDVNKPITDSEIVVSADKKEIKFIGSQRYIPGLNVFEFNKDTFGIRQILPESVDAEVVPKKNMITGRKQKGSTSITKKKFKVKENCEYIQATNLKNAKKKIEKLLIKHSEIEK